MTVSAPSSVKVNTSGFSAQQPFNPTASAKSTLVAQVTPQTVKKATSKVAPSLERQLTKQVAERGIAPVAAEAAERTLGINIIKGLGKFTKVIPLVGVLVEIGSEAVFPASTAVEPDMIPKKLPPKAKPVTSSDVQIRLNKIYREQARAKENSGVKDGISCKTDVSVSRISNVGTTVFAKTTATNKQGIVVPARIEQSTYMYKNNGIFISPKVEAGIGSLQSTTVTPGTPPSHIVVVKGFCDNIPSSVRTVDRIYSR